MALILRGSTVCPICGKVISATDKVMGFPPLAYNENDPLYIFHDAGCHEACVLNHPLWPKLQERLSVTQRVGKPVCLICKQEIANADEYTGIGHLTDDPNSPLYPFNNVHFHRAHFNAWPERDRVLKLLEELCNKGDEWKSLRSIIDDLKRKPVAQGEVLIIERR